MRIAVYTDYPYRRDGDVVYAERAFVLFLGQLARTVDRLVLIGRLNPDPGRFERSHYRVADEIELAPLPHYESLASPVGAVRAMRGSARAFARAIDDVDAVWLLGPHPFCLLFAAIAAAKRKRVFLGVRQDLPRYARTRHPDRRSVHLIADLLEGSYRLLARRCPAIVVGSELAANYRRGRAVLPISVSLIRSSDVATAEALPPRDYSGVLTALSVGRLEEEKNPLLLADTMAEVAAAGGRWRLAVCGEGPLREALEDRLRELGVADRVDLLGYLPLDGGLLDLYRESHALLHESWTEGVPQILFEAFAVGLPIVATDVGGVAAAVGDDALLIPAGAAEPAAAALTRIGEEPRLRERLVAGGLERARSHTLEAECERVARFFESPFA